jgi:ferredoxin
MKITSVYFSATYTTKKVVEYIAKQLSGEITAYDITNNGATDEVHLTKDEAIIVGIPVYAGRIPAMAIDRIRRFKGNGARAIAIAVYGNRDYDDALLELSDLLSANGFHVISAGAFIAQHSIFPKVGAHRPDTDDYQQMDAFANETQKILGMDNAKLLPIHIRGNRPYKIPGSIPIFPSGTKTCKECGICAKLCPTGAIPLEHPKEVDETLCIKCGRCIVVCPTQSRRFQGLNYTLASIKFNSSYKERREPEFFFARYN